MKTKVKALARHTPQSVREEISNVSMEWPGEVNAAFPDNLELHRFFERAYFVRWLIATNKLSDQC